MTETPEEDVHKLTFILPVATDDGRYGRGFITIPLERENVNWRIGLLGVEDNQYKIQLMCNQEDKSNFWSLSISLELYLRKNEEELEMHTGEFEFKTRKFLIIKLPLEKVESFADKKVGVTVDIYITVLKKEGIRPKRIHNFSVRDKHLHNLKMVLEGKTIYCNKQIVALNSEVFRELLFPDGNKQLTEIKLPDNFEYEKILRLIKVFYNDSDALSAETVEETLELATNLKSVNARQRCEKWIIKTHTIPSTVKMGMAEKYGLIELQNECVSMLKTSQQMKRLLEGAHDFSESEITELMNKMALSFAEN